MRYIALAALLLAACSGGGNNPTPPNPPWSKVAAHVLRLAGILAYLDWAWRTAGRSLLVGEPTDWSLLRHCCCASGAGLFLAAHPCRAAADRVERAACQCTSCAPLDLQEWQGRSLYARRFAGTRLAKAWMRIKPKSCSTGLVQAGWLRPITSPPGRHSGGRPRRRWAVNAKLFLSGTAGTAGTAVPPL